MCLWVLREIVPESLKPNKSHVIMYVEGGVLVCTVDMAYPEAAERNDVAAYLAKAAQVLPVVLVKGDKVWIEGPPHLVEAHKAKVGKHLYKEVLG